MTAGVLYLVATPIGNLEDMTYRAVRVLSESDIVAAEDTRTARRLLEHFEIPFTDLRSLFEGNEAARADELVGSLLAGKSVAVISEAGTPVVSDPGQRLVDAAVARDVRVVAIPGANAAVSALIGSGLDGAEFRFIGFPPRQAGARRKRFGGLRTDPATLIYYESPKRLADSLADARDAFGQERKAVVARELTKIYEEYVRGTLAKLAERYASAPPRGECTVVVAGADDEQTEIDVEAEVRRLIGEGLGAKDIAARLMVKTGRPRRELYQLALSLSRTNS